VRKFILLVAILVMFPLAVATQNSFFIQEDTSAPVVKAEVGQLTRLVYANSPNGKALHLSIDGVKLKLEGNSDAFDEITVAPGEVAVIQAIFTEPGRYEVINNGEQMKLMSIVEVESNRKFIFDIVGFLRNL